MSEDSALELLALLNNAAELLMMKSPEDWTVPEGSFMEAATFMWDLMRP